MQKAKLDRKQIVSAQVTLRSASGKSIRGHEPITSQNIRDYQPSAESVQAATKAFADAGFEVGPVVLNNFSITAPLEVFERVFGTRLQLEGGEVKAARAGGGASLELPLESLDKRLAAYVEAVTFSPLPDFGPTNW